MRTELGFIAAIALSICISAAFCQEPASKPVSNSKIEEKMLGKMLDNRTSEMVSDDGCHYAYQTGNKIVYDGVEGPACDQIIKGPTMSKNGTMLSFVAKQKGSIIVIVNGIVYSGLESLENFVVGDDGNATAWLSTRNSDRYWAFLLNGKEIKTLQKPKRAHEMVINSSGRFLYWAEIWLSVEIPPLEDGNGQGAWKPHVYLDGNDKGTFLDVDGKSLSISPDGKQYSIAVTNDPARKRWFLILNDAHSREYSEYGPVCFGPNGRRNAFIAKYPVENAKPHVVLDNKDCPEYDKIDEKSMTFSSDGSKFACLAVKQGKDLMFIEGREQPLEHKPASFCFSPDGRSLAMVMPKGEKKQLVLNGKAGKEYDDISLVTFNPDGTKIAFAAKQGNNWMVVSDGKELPAYAGVFTLRFMPDFRKVVYLASKGSTQAIVLDDMEVAEYPMIASGAPKIYTNGQLEFLVVKDNKLVRVTCTPHAKSPAKPPAGPPKEGQAQTQPAQ